MFLRGWRQSMQKFCNPPPSIFFFPIFCSCNWIILGPCFMLTNECLKRMKDNFISCHSKAKENFLQIFWFANARKMVITHLSAFDIFYVKIFLWWSFRLCNNKKFTSLHWTYIICEIKRNMKVFVCFNQTRQLKIKAACGMGNKYFDSLIKREKKKTSIFRFIS